jgi:predicted aspartyl protease
MLPQMGNASSAIKAIEASIMEKLKLSRKAKKVTSLLVESKDSEYAGYIAAVDPQTGEAFYGKTIAEAAKEGRKRKNDPKAVFFFVRVGYPSVHVLKTVRLQGYIYQDYFPQVKGYIRDGSLNLVYSDPEDGQPLEFIVDTGFSGSLVLDARAIQRIEEDYVGGDEVTLAGGVKQPVSIYLCDVAVDTFRLTEIEIVEMEDEYLIGMALMRAMCKRAIFAFENNDILFEA